MTSERVTHRRVLLVDHNSYHRGELRRALARRGFSVSIAATGEQALEILLRGATDAAILADANATEVAVGCGPLQNTFPSSS